MSDTIKIPFSVYDFFGYLAAGLLICFGIDRWAGTNWLLRDDLAIQEIAALTTIAYIVGHINAGFSSWFLERYLVGHLLGRPYTTLFQKRSPRLRSLLFPGYYTTLPIGIQARILSKAKSRKINETGEVLFHHARTIAKTDAITWARLDCFLERYGFCRNISFALLLSALLLWFEFQRSGGQVLLNLSAVALVSAICMFYRYLKFYRQYSYELFTAYPDILHVKEKQA